LVFSDRDLEAMRQLKTAFDPEGILNPGKILPDPLGLPQNL